MKTEEIVIAMITTEMTETVTAMHIEITEDTMITEICAKKENAK